MEMGRPKAPQFIQADKQSGGYFFSSRTAWAAARIATGTR